MPFRSRPKEAKIEVKIYLLVDQPSPNFVLFAELCNDSLNICEKPIRINVDTVQTARLGFIIRIDSPVNFAFDDLSMSPIWEAGLRITGPTVVTRIVVRTESRNGGRRVLQLFTVNV